VSNLPLEWQALISKLNELLKSLGASAISKEEFKFLVSSFQGGVPTNAQEARSRLTIKPRDVSSSLFSNEKIECSDNNTTSSSSFLRKKSKSPKPKPFTVSEPQNVQRGTLTVEQQLAIETTKVKAFEESLNALKAQQQPLKEDKKRLEESIVELEEKYQLVVKERDQLLLQLNEEKKKAELDRKKSQSEIQYLQRRNNLANEQQQKKALEVTRSQERVKKLQEDFLLMMKQQTKESVKVGGQNKNDTDWEAMKKNHMETLQELNAKLQEEQTSKMKLEKANQDLELDLMNIKLKLEEAISSQLDAEQMKKKYLKELDELKKQTSSEIQKIKLRLKRSEEMRDKLLLQNEQHLQGTINSFVTTEKSVASDNGKKSESEENNILPPPPPQILPSAAPEETGNNGLLGAIKEVKLKASKDSPSGNDASPLKTTTVQTENIASILAQALLIRRKDMKEHDESSEDEQEKEEWD